MATQDPLKERFEILRRRARQSATSATQQEQEGLRRRFAQIGQVGSGAQIKSEAQAAERGAKRLQSAEETVGLAELAERQRLQEAAEARQFATSEREAGQGFAAEQAGLGRQFASGERRASQAFAAEQAGIGRAFTAEQAEAQRKFARGERLSSQEFAALQAGKQREFAREERRAGQEFAQRESALARDLTIQLNKAQRAFQEKAFNEGVRQWDESFNRDSRVIDFNMEMARQAASQTFLGDLGLGSPKEALKTVISARTAGWGQILGDQLSNKVRKWHINR